MGKPRIDYTELFTQKSHHHITVVNTVNSLDQLEPVGKSFALTRNSRLCGILLKLLDYACEKNGSQWASTTKSPCYFFFYNNLFHLTDVRYSMGEKICQNFRYIVTYKFLNPFYLSAPHTNHILGCYSAKIPSNVICAGSNSS